MKKLLLEDDIVLTIITVCFNDKKQLKRTIESVKKQTIFNSYRKHIEYLVIDGGSTDGTLDILNTEFLSGTLSFSSEKDNGIYDAMNKGIRKANGRWIQLLNAGDIYHSNNVLEKIWKYLINDSSSVLYGDTFKYDKYHSAVVRVTNTDNILWDMIFCHQSLFFNASKKESIMYDTRYKIVSDYNTVLKLYLKNKKFKHIPEIIVDYNMNGVSANNLVTTYEEIWKVRRDNGLLDSSFKEKLFYLYGKAKRQILSRMPLTLRWKISSVAHKILGHEAIH